MNPLVASLIFGAFAFLGRWLQLNPEKIIPVGSFMGRDTFGARFFRAQVALVGTGAVFGGTAFAVYSLTRPMAPESLIGSVMIWLITVLAGIAAAMYVRKEVQRKPVHQNNNPHGWYP
jgi:hypothetical protein